VLVFIRKKMGEMPTGRLADVAKASGCSSVHDLLQKGNEAVAAAHVDGAQAGEDDPIEATARFKLFGFWIIP
jgi:hypothetical protein